MAVSETSKRRGRPNIEDPKNIVRSFRFNNKENELLNRISGETGKADADVVKKALSIYAKLLDIE